MHVQGSRYQNIRETQCVFDEAIASSKERIVARPNLAKGSAIVHLCVFKGTGLLWTEDASKYLASLREKRQLLILQFTKSNSDMNPNS